MNKLQQIDDLGQRLIGFAMAVKDMRDFQRPLTYDQIVNELLNYATEYERIRNELPN